MLRVAVEERVIDRLLVPVMVELDVPVMVELDEPVMVELMVADSETVAVEEVV